MFSGWMSTSMLVVSIVAIASGTGRSSLVIPPLPRCLKPSSWSLTSWAGEHPKVFTMSSSRSSSSSSSWVSCHLHNHNHDYHWNHHYNYYRIIYHHHHHQFLLCLLQQTFYIKNCHLPLPPPQQDRSWSWGRPWMSGKPLAQMMTVQRCGQRTGP